MNRAELARFRRKIHVSNRTDPNVGTPCWLWLGDRTPNGYGKHRLAPGATQKMAHRLSYEHYVGPIPIGKQIDHRCHTAAVAAGTCEGGDACLHRRCVNPEHLEPVTGSENTLRQDHAERRVTHCPKGHPYTPDNTIERMDGKRRCRECDRARKRKPH